ncbi:uncharacterized protein ACIQIH_001472 [Cyanocitta cristata]
MAQSVVYADLKFAAGPPSTVPDEDDSPYENVPLGPVTAAPSPGRWTRRWHVPRALLAASLLLLLLLVAVVVLGAYCDVPTAFPLPPTVFPLPPTASHSVPTAFPLPPAAFHRFSLSLLAFPMSPTVFQCLPSTCHHGGFLSLPTGTPRTISIHSQILLSYSSLLEPCPRQGPMPTSSSTALSPDWQVTRSLQDTSREHMAEQGRLSQELQAQEQSLEQTQLELAWAREELQRVWHEYNITQMELESRNAELGHIQQELAVLQEEMQVVQGKLNTSKNLVSSLRACVNTDCCPKGWVLYRSKCLYISMAKKTWQESHQDCVERSAQLLVQDDWSPFLVPHFVQASNARYWIGARIFYETGSSVWMDSKYSRRYNSDCWSVGNGELWSLACKNLFQWICEKSPNLSSASETRPPFLTKD